VLRMAGIPVSLRPGRHDARRKGDTHNGEDEGEDETAYQVHARVGIHPLAISQQAFDHCSFNRKPKRVQESLQNLSDSGSQAFSCPETR
jgi:hypothetical protein